ncbi:panthothenate synthetase [Carboxylicivirga sp. M1479]|uniref:panthothenate synthetase n=1 Tax=Carboxylicivirga sp. M1479 TaxID=2594476 RepID=UPI0011788E65|nr:panthothenate synthetase [Carboxylicivirga sp. M1479]TRX71447.1 panthothenate synthetase [Carboxylicivirga sp. M1479]
MKMLVNVVFPIEPFNTLMRDGKAGELIGRIVDDIKPESIHFTDHEGNRGAVMLVDVKDESMVPLIAEPWYLTFEAFCEFKVAMATADLMKADLGKLAEKWK